MTKSEAQRALYRRDKSLARVWMNARCSILTLNEASMEKSFTESRRSIMSVLSVAHLRAARDNDG